MKYVQSILMNYTHIIMHMLLLTTLCIPYNCFAALDQQAIMAKESADKALAEATTAELTKGAKYETVDEKSRVMLEKAMSALNAAQSALSGAEFILQDKEKSTESKNLANEAKKTAKQAIKKCGSVLANNYI